MSVDEPVTVGMVGGAPRYVIWNGRSYTITKVGLHHFFREGKTLYHVFSVLADTLFLRLKFNTENLLWKLEDAESRF